MMHRNRRFSVAVIESPEELAKKLTSTTWTLCTGFSVAGHPHYLLLNDATSEDGASEYAVVRGGVDAPAWRQIESITFSWCKETEALGYIRQTLSGAFDQNDFARPIDLRGRLDRPESHRRCPLCE